jgi:membrane protease YdiL (CAAX protease family)
MLGETPRLRGRDVAVGVGLTTGLALLVTGLATALSDPPLVRAGRALSFALLSLPPLLLAVPAWLRAARSIVDAPATRWIAGAALLVALAPERLSRGSVSDLVGVALYAAVALAITADRPRGSAPLARDLLLVLWLWLPMEIRELRELLWIRGDFVLLRLYGLDLLILLYVVERRSWEPGRIVPWSRHEWGWGLGCYAAFVAVAIPAALATGFATPGFSDRGTGGWALFLVSTFWVIALPEEALFRGVIQGLLLRVLRVPAWAIVLAAIVFGLSHMNNVNNGIVPDWSYVVLAGLAGVAYGIAYHKTGNIAAPTLTHFLVDITWRGFFAG